MGTEANQSRTVLALAAGLLLLWMGGRPAAAQFARVHGAARLTTDQVTHLYASWENHEAIHGVLLVLPSEWTLEEARLLRFGFEPVPVEVQPLEDGRYVIAAERPIRSPHEFVLRVRTGATPGPGAWSVTPFVRGPDGRRLVLEGFRDGATVDVRLPQPAGENRVLRFAAGEGPPLLLRRAALPGLDDRGAFTVAFWFKTTGLDEVLLSTWDGDERRAYALEVVVGRGGRLAVYRGRPGEHLSMVSPVPVADGTWHHAGITYDAASGRSRLYLDGQAVDSLHAPGLPMPASDTPLALGGRIPSDASTARGYGGEIDELAVLRGAEHAATIHALMRTPALRRGDASPRQGFQVGFEEEVSPALLAEASPVARRVASDLAFHAPVSALRAEIEGASIHITWESSDDQVERFAVERSTDGKAFVEAGRVDPSEAEPDGSYRFLDRNEGRDVLFYRVRQLFRNGNERLSATIKLGIGGATVGGATLIGNFPNPFSSATTISYELDETRHVRLTVWDLAGQQVAALVDRPQAAGVHEVPFESRDLPSGTYFVRLQTDGRTQTQKIILTR